MNFSAFPQSQAAPQRLDSGVNTAHHHDNLALPLPLLADTALFHPQHLMVMNNQKDSVYKTDFLFFSLTKYNK